MSSTRPLHQPYGAEPRPQTPEEFGRYINAEFAKWAKIVKDNNVQLPGAR
jgi:tripartite-type tricarboxylate transporter receptor subunit TctC